MNDLPSPHSGYDITRISAVTEKQGWAEGGVKTQ